ncbi:MAG: SMC-Scp complex subunit ScpB [Candidatus Hydrogenedentes bacterium]|jgi:segregation and condensation protein B|nr:SMC-Scp complex subunit ScpB [Candidatus Hydrogenedentota bacterium]MDY0031011.1 SMC-Scp complex subunit ScpB [FCB group bacterium]NLT60409.1 SMC-Scp complex subunit ScpB [Candidatus Hydrogenedentota bacterium]HNV21141.1 SMC-Scp complex subunit ScpB [Candidatus Hydrogenedentota bacterium]HNZ20165.1 SMC-Scp complex subunit ScpB [Candidatus Hydrogenedentota bacterium]
MMAEENIQDTDAPGDIEEIEALEQPAGEENDSLEADDTGASADEDAGPYDDGLLDDEDGDNELEPVEQLGRDETRAVLHALLFVSDKPTSVDRFSEALGGVDYDVVRNLLAELREEIDDLHLPYVLREIAGGYQLATRSEFAPYIRRMFQIKRRNRLSKAVLETLAIIAYKQPCTRADVESIRGVSVSHAFEILREKRLIKVAGVAETVGRPKIYRTTDEFLAHFGIKSLKELPTIEELRETI